jgi:hypothetical protein
MKRLLCFKDMVTIAALKKVSPLIGFLQFTSRSNDTLAVCLSPLCFSIECATRMSGVFPFYGDRQRNNDHP